ncbi:hypothetical protein STRIP9103_01324 [Streptomyces ipomoeae 91-03]|uniref:Uncharacterized protein n=1 Tax=Streptomyces ipomoeae 91-03 TaxID=698759 RepID=L1L0T5_9ACTN|nr:hypothetical protein STRIP9103_01324 [Streptomyces ipomoeae 91-03]
MRRCEVMTAILAHRPGVPPGGVRCVGTAVWCGTRRHTGDGRPL